MVLQAAPGDGLRLCQAEHIIAEAGGGAPALRAVLRAEPGFRVQEEDGATGRLVPRHFSLVAPDVRSAVQPFSWFSGGFHFNHYKLKTCSRGSEDSPDLVWT